MVHGRHVVSGLEGRADLGPGFKGYSGCLHLEARNDYCAKVLTLRLLHLGLYTTKACSGLLD